MPNVSPYNFSIILPVRNGGEYVKECVRSILSQTVSSFDLIILDSGSTDGTIEWLHALNDPKIIIHRAERPLTITENWARVTTVKRNEWMTLIGHDDVLYPDYLATMTKLIGQYPDASLYQSHFDFIDADGKFLRKCKPMAEKENAGQLLDKILDNAINIYGTGFMMRTKDYDAVGGIPMFPNLMSADYVLWLKLSAVSYKATSEQTCFAYRLNQSTTATTTNAVYITALKLFIDYLMQSKETLSPGEDWNAYVKKILAFYSRRVSRRLVLSEPADREDLTVGRFVEETKEYSRNFLDADHSFDPLSLKDVRMAKLIDSSVITRKLFRFIKKIYPNPLVK